MNNFKKIYILSLFFVLFGSVLFAGSGPAFTSIQDGSKLIEVEGVPEGNQTVIYFTIYDGDFKSPSTKEIVIDGIGAKSVVATGYHCMNDKTKLRFIELTLKEKFFSKEGTSVWVSPEFRVLSKVHFDISGVKTGSPHDKSFFKNELLPCFPTDHSYGVVAATGNFESDGWLEAGTLIYLHYDFKVCEPTGADRRVTSTKNNASVNSEIFCIKGDSTGIRKVWSMDIEEERILFYHTDCIDGKIFLYTSYIKGAASGNEEVLESRIRMIDGKTGKVVYNVLLDVKSGYELCVSSMFYDVLKSELFWAGNYISLETKPWKKNDGEMNSFFAVGKISAEGTPRSTSFENKWEVSESKAKNNSTPLLMVRGLAVTNNGELVVAGLHGYWNGDCSASNYTFSNGYTTNTFVSYGLQVIYFGTSLEKTGSQQIIVPPPLLGAPLVLSMACAIQASVYCYDNYEPGDCVRTRWDASVQTMSFLLARYTSGVSNSSTQYYAINAKKDEKPTITSVGRISEGQYSYKPGAILDSHRCAVRKAQMSRDLVIEKF